MRKIKVTLEINEVEDWVVDWQNEAEKKGELKNLSYQIEFGLSKELGINLSNINVLKTELSDIN